MTNLKPMHCPQCGKYPVTWLTLTAWVCRCMNDDCKLFVIGSGETKARAVRNYNADAKKHAKLLAREARKAAKEKKPAKRGK